MDIVALYDSNLKNTSRKLARYPLFADLNLALYHIGHLAQRKEAYQGDDNHHRRKNKYGKQYVVMFCFL